MAAAVTADHVHDDHGHDDCWPLLMHRTAGNYHCSIRVSVSCMGVLWRWRCVSPRGVGVPG